MANCAAERQGLGRGDLANVRVLAKNSALNLVGNAAPMVVALFTIPVLTRALGPDRFGIITLSWVVVGYFGLFDLGLGRAVTQMVADRIGKRSFEEIPDLFWTALAVLSLLGASATVLFAALTPVIVTRLINIRSGMQAEAIHAFWILSITIPFVVVTTAMRGLLEAFQRFDYITYLRVPLGVLLYLGPVLVLPFTHSVVATVVVFLIARVLACAGHLALCFKVQPSIRHQIRVQKRIVPMLLKFGGWMTVSNVVSPLMVSMDRFFVAAVLSVSAVAYYAAPYEVVTKLLVIPGAIAGVLFPAFSTTFSGGGDAKKTYVQSIKAILFVVAPVALIVAVFAEEGLQAWLGADFATNGAPVVKWLALGVLLNSIAHVPFALIQAAGKPEITAKIHLVELPVYAYLVTVLTMRFGITGAAMAWTARVVVDLCLLLWGSARLLEYPFRFSKQWFWALPFGVVAGVLVFVDSRVVVRMVGTAAWLPAFVAFGWFALLEQRSRARILLVVQGYFGAGAKQ